MKTRLSSASSSSLNLIRHPGYHHPRSHGWMNMKSGQITPGIHADEYQGRRNKLLASIPDDHAIVVCTGYKKRYRSANVFHRFHQNTDILYLSGMNEPRCVNVFIKSGVVDRFLAFVNQPSAHDLMWDGSAVDVDSAVKHFQADEAFDLSELPRELGRHLRKDKVTPVYLNAPMASIQHALKSDSGDQHQAWDSVLPFIQQHSASISLKPLGHIIASLRLLKSEAEIELLQTAADIASSAFENTMRMRGVLKTEHDIANQLEYDMKRMGAQSMAYVPVVAGSSLNASVIHYTRNDMQLVGGQLALVDAGALYNGYCSDVTRTFPVDGKFTFAQKQVYDAMYELQQSLMDNHVSVGMTLRRLLDISLEMMRKMVLEQVMGLSQVESGRLVHQLYPHHVSHHLGMDVHDCRSASRKDAETLRENMCITVEPGIYIPPGLSSVPNEFQGICIRIEDDIIVKQQQQKPLILTRKAPKSSGDIERIMSNQ